ncbi:type IX secretion system outer membrane channel protein PorV [Flavobacterium sp. CS20]|uniref:type IX secretion system outer membrane channel protein PorV n=1 Tax=Flavobacterium sp. CS20 TaxID=2775246 RepID=UPI001B39D7B5|nr:type IX secretion system outer membrane channel protein PorV [Flavobacterium sp. CS20]QTY28029.1 type IX secretion system outer membrane channel protein PorV [Flavobacterium sp. CS20]
MKYKHLFIVLLSLGTISKSFSQEEPRRVITTAVPFLLIAGDARSSGMGDQGIATPVDAFSQQWNPAKYAFSETRSGFGLGYTPYLRELVTDINLGQLSYFNRINQRSAFAGSIRFFGLGGVELRETADQVPREVEPNEFAVDLSYALRLNEKFSMAVTGKFIRSDQKIPGLGGDATAANTFVADISAFYRGEEVFYNNFNGRWRFGGAIQNIGPKIKFDDAGQENFLPTNLKLGAGHDFILDPSNTIGLYVEFNKLLVPTPSDSNGDGVINREDDWANEGEFSAIFSSFGDAPDGFSEELKEVTWAIGAEYWYEDSFAFRVGYFNESEEKGFRQFLTLGAGFKYSSINIDASYLFSTTPVQNPLEGTLRFSLTFNIGDNAYIEY